MTDFLNTYSKYRKSDVPWLGDIPEHWELKRLGALLQERGETNSSGLVENVLSVTRNRGVILYTDKGNIGNKKSEDTTRYKIVRIDDIVMNSMNVIIGSVGISKYIGSLSPVYYVLRSRSRDINPKFIHYYFQSSIFQLSLTRLGKGILPHRMRIPMVLLKAEPIPLPSMYEQSAIVKYLDYVDKRVKKYIRAKQKQIKLLEEMKQAIIHQAVTRGLDPTVPLKPSGVDWLGEIPHNWIVKRIKHSVKTSKSGTWGDDPTGDDDIICVRVADFDRDYLTIREDKLTYRSILETQREGRLLCPGDLLLEKSGGGENQSVGTVVYYNRDLKAVCSNFIDKITLADSYDPHFLVFLHSMLYSKKIPVRSIKQTTGIQNLDTCSYFNEKVAFPPLADQLLISEYLERTVDYFEDKKNVERSCIRLLREYQTSLIADVVTGKLDVREAASQLPDELEGLLEEPDETLEEDLENREEMEEAVPEEE